MEHRKCDICGQFSGSKGGWLYDLWQPDYWNGPRMTFYCAKHLKAEQRKRDRY